MKFASYLIFIIIGLRGYVFQHISRHQSHRAIRTDKRYMEDIDIDESENDTLRKIYLSQDNITLGNSDSKNVQYSIINTEEQRINGLFPPLFDVAPTADITVNATCGITYLGSEETFCKLGGSMQCGICSGFTGDKKHAILYAIDNDTSNWWQSPTLNQGSEFEYVTIIMDLKQEYYVWYIIIKCAISPRPANWILERSLDGVHYTVWQYFVANEDDCWQRYKLFPTSSAAGSHAVLSDNETLCSTFYSKIKPLEGGEIHAFIAKGRPGCIQSCTVLNTQELKKFSSARYLRFRFQKFNIPKDKYSSLSDPSFKRRLFYSIKKISVGAQCICHGHANKCKRSSDSIQPRCECQHNTCGVNCEQCCPMYNQTPWKEATISEVTICEECQCHGHAEACRYDAHIDASNSSLNTRGEYSGGGVCINCTKHTTGINCEKCESGWYRPIGINPDSDKPCVSCDCHQIGSTGHCVSDDSKFVHENKKPGTCECLQGFDGVKCDRCATGYYNFPNCEKCMCDSKGTNLTASCEKRCICKVNVAGEMCDRCKSGYFGLSANDSLGCKECYCSGLSNICNEAFDYRLSRIRTLNEWVITNINVTSFSTPLWDNEEQLLTVTDDEVQVDANNYYWLAPNQYTGNKLSSYGLTLRLSISWTVMRGDTSGKPVFNPDVIIVGNNGLKIAHGNKQYEDVDQIMLSIRLSEDGWFLLPNYFINSNHHYSYEPVIGEHVLNRREILSVLSDIRHILLRAKFHTDQIDCSLLEVELETGIKEENEDKELVTGLEQCSCPAGYIGLSCERCDYGYTRLQPETKFDHFICTLCDCNGHSPSCDPVTGQCNICEHNTTGVKCGKCLDGYYGNAEQGTPIDCQMCACPLLVPSNNFSPTCVLMNEVQNEYFCDKCPIGYTGAHCELCSEGYFGNPSQIGSKCKPCDCNGGPCNTTNGQCLSCRDNTEGWNCEQCKDGYYGNAPEKNCRKCKCDIRGSINTTFCNKYNGQCECKMNFIGRMCDRCLEGYGNLSAGCIPCNCNILGSEDHLCSPITGLCSCKDGVTGAFCDRCLDNFYDFDSGIGCSSCACNVTGSVSENCDVISGQCSCKKNVVGRKCDLCDEGFWDFNEDGCKSCECSEIGSLSSLCDISTGQCPCKFGITGRKCDQCRDNFYGYSKYGCFECEKCSASGHICDVHNGRCVCPIRTEGSNCQRCVPGSWNFIPNEGCRECACDRQGSKSNQCNVNSGQCECRTGYSGDKCNICAPGYYGYPKCRPCSCNRAGSDPETCFENHCLCDNSGQCYCKVNVIGKKCDQCKNGTFGLDSENIDGCTACYCFGRSTLCSEAGLTWSHIRLRPDRILLVHYDLNNNASLNFNSTDVMPINTQQICYFNLAVQNNDGSKHLEISENNVKLNTTNNLRIIPGDIGSVEIGVNYLFDVPVYWQLPSTFLGDRILSYGGFIEFTAETEGETTLLSPAVIASYPLIQIQGNNKFILEFFPSLITTDKHYRIRLQESLWKLKNNPSGHVSRDIFMLTLQNIQYILIRASISADFTKAVLSDVSLDTAVRNDDQLPPLSSITHGIELCQCPIEYTSSSCQNPSIGYYRYYGNETSVKSTIVIEVIGEAVRCNCNGYSSVCDVESGYCLNCSNNTGGPHCEKCAAGYYKNEIDGSCKSCQCPSATYNHAYACYISEQNNKENSVACYCEVGYTGKFCDRCNYGWYGYPKIGYCKPCNCNRYGSISDECHEETGQCNCKPDSIGRDCSLCEKKNHALTMKGCVLCEDPCVKILIEEIENVTIRFEIDSEETFHGKLKPPLHLLAEINFKLNETQQKYDSYVNSFLLLSSYSDVIDDDLRKRAKLASSKIKRIWKHYQNVISSINELRYDIVGISETAQILLNEIKSVVLNLERYLKSKQTDFNLPVAVNEARNLLNNIKDADNSDLIEKAKKIKSVCAVTDDAVRKHESTGPGLELLKKKIEKLIERITDIDLITSNIDTNIQEVRYYISASGNRVQWILNTSAGTNEIFSEINDLLGKNEFYHDATLQLVNLTENNLKNVVVVSNDLKHLYHLAEEKEGILFNLNPVYLEKYVIPAMKHANTLQNQVKHYVSLFSATKQDADIALKASTAYKNIVDALEEAKTAINEANIDADVVSNKLYSKVNGNSTLERAVSTEQISRQLKILANVELMDVDTLRQQYLYQQKNVDSLDKILQEVTTNVSFISYQFKDMNRTKYQLRTMNESLEKFKNLIDIPDELYDSIFFIQDNINDELKQKLYKLRSYGEISLSPKDELKLKQTEEDISKMIIQLNSTRNLFSERYKYFEKWNFSIANQLLALKNRIDETKHLANGVHLSMSSKNDQELCIRSYRSKYLQSSIVNHITLTYAISSHHRDALLFYLTSSVSGDFLAIEMINRKIRFVWDIGGGPAELVHPLHIQTAGDLQKDQHWYKIEVERIANVGKLSVRPVISSAGSILMHGFPVTNTSVIGWSRLDVSNNDEIWIGGTNEQVSPFLLSKPSGLIGCLYNVFFDNRPIGLWNFESEISNNCIACVQGPEEMREDDSYFFMGDGYSVLPGGSTVYNKYFFSVAFNFKTFDENAVLLYAAAANPEQYISITMKDGRVLLQIGYTNELKLEIKSTNRYTTGNWTHLEAARYYDRKRKTEKGVLKVGSETKDAFPSPTSPNQNDIPDLSTPQYFVGGLPPDFKPPISLPGSFLGCMSDLQVVQESYSPMRAHYWGIQKSCLEKPFSMVGFQGNGYLELASYPLKKLSSFSFVFSTTQPDTFLMLSTTEGFLNSIPEVNDPDDEVQDKVRKINYYSICLRDGRVELVVNAGKGETQLLSRADSYYSDGQFHSINVIKSGRRLELRIDDIIQGIGFMREDGSNIIKAAGIVGGLFFGGLPSDVNLTYSANSDFPLIGTIKDAIFNEKLLYFDRPIEFERAFIGRLGPQQSYSPWETFSLTQNTQSAATNFCHKTQTYSTEPFAVQFGNFFNSFVRLDYDKQVFHNKGAVIELSFRTFYSDGILLIIPGSGEKQVHYLRIFLYDGRIFVVVKGKKRIEMQCETVYNDGNWHQVRIIRNGKTLHLIVDNVLSQKVTIPKKLHLMDAVFVGGFPSEIQMFESSLLKIEALKGCIKEVIINGKKEDLVGESAKHHHVGQCFPRVEKGAYFPGDAYVVYVNDFYIGKSLKFELEFRTSEMNGILASISEPEGYPALSLELNHGKIILNGDMGDRRPFKIEQNDSASYSLCDNEWHRVKVVFINEEIALYIDNTSKIYWLSDNGHITEAHTNSPFYIGGIPEHATGGTLENKENFKGCIRNIEIGDHKVKWTEFSSLYNVLITSCPTLK